LSKKHCLRIASLDPWPSVEIGSDEFRAIKEAKAKLTTVLGIEEKFALLVENYAEYERTLLDLSLKNMINQDWVWGGFMDDMLLVNRRIANLLTVTTLYIDQIPCDLCRIFGDTAGAGVEFKAARLVEAKNCLEFRVMRELRNHIQHRDLAIGNLSYPASHQTDGRSGVRFGIEVTLDVEGICSDPKLRIDPADLRADAAKDVTAVLRKSMDSLSRIHEWVREKTEEVVVGALQKIDHTLRIAEVEIGHLHGLAAVEYDDDTQDLVYVFEDLPKRVRQMRTRYGTLKLCSGWYVSSGLGAGD
jgi:hypothetical protein